MQELRLPGPIGTSVKQALTSGVETVGPECRSAELPAGQGRSIAL
jgi:hypothetical protein